MKYLTLGLSILLFVVSAAGQQGFDVESSGEVKFQESEKPDLSLDTVYSFEVTEVNDTAEIRLEFSDRSPGYELRRIQAFQTEKLYLYNYRYGNNSISTEVVRPGEYHFVAADLSPADSTYIEDFDRCLRMLNPDKFDIPVPACSLEEFRNFQENSNLYLGAGALISVLLLVLGVITTGKIRDKYRYRKLIAEVNELQENLEERPETSREELEELLDIEQLILDSKYDKASERLSSVSKKQKNYK
jgi:hypothetical protein